MQPRLRDSKKRKLAPYPLGKFPKEYIYNMAKRIVYLYAIGKSDISGEEWGDVFAKGTNGEHLSKPLGLADVVKDGFAWSVKSVSNKKPHFCDTVRVISGRNDINYSYGIKNPHKNVQKSGDCVLEIWNERVRIALDSYDDLRIVILIRNINLMQFTLFELEGEKYKPEMYEWKLNKNGNFEGYEKITGNHKFTWQTGGRQFTIIHTVPTNATKFTIKRPEVIDFEELMTKLGFCGKNWVNFVDNGQV